MNIALTVILAIVFTALILLALGGNLLVCIAVLWDRRLRRQHENLFLISLAVSDLLVSILVMVFAAANDLIGRWTFGQVYCKIWLCFDVMCCTASILNLCAIALDRYWHISKPMLYVRYINKRRICYSIVVVWILSIAIGFLQLLFEHEGSSGSAASDGSTCQLKLSVGYAIASSTLSFFLPAAIMVLLYTKMYLYARKHVRNIRQQLQAVTGVLLVHSASVRLNNQRKGTDSSETPMTHNRPTPRQLTPPSPGAASTSVRNSPVLHMKGDKAAATQSRVESKEVSDQKARVTLGVIMGTFLICWLPFFCINVLRAFGDGEIIPLWLFLTVTWLGYANSTLNPIIYSIFNRDFRRAFRRILLLLCIVCQRETERFNNVTRPPTHIDQQISHSWSERPVNCHRLDAQSGNKKYSYMSVDL